MFTFTPMSEEDSLGLMQKGDYEAVVKFCTPEVSKRSGKPQLHVVLNVYDNEGKMHLVEDYLSEYYMQFKLRHYSLSILDEETYQKGEFDPQSTEGKPIRARIYISEDKEGKYPPKNAVADYFKSQMGSMKDAIQGGIDQNFNDDLPF